MLERIQNVVRLLRGQGSLISLKEKLNMKKMYLFAALLCLSLSFYGCSGKPALEGEPVSESYDLIPMIMIDGALYLDTNQKTPLGAAAVVSGEILSSVDGTQKPTENGQSNFGCVGNPYVLQDDSVFVLIDQDWFLFKKEKTDSQTLTLEAVIELSHKGESLSWQDFELYKGTEIGSGLYILSYEIDDQYVLLVGGGSLQESPMYIRLVNKTDETRFIEIRDGNVENWLSGDGVGVD